MTEKPMPSIQEALSTLHAHGVSLVCTLEPVDCRALRRLVEYLCESLRDVRRERARLQQQLLEAERVNARLDKRVKAKRVKA